MFQPTRFNTIIFDFDSTLASIEGIDELARMKGKLNLVAKLTRQAMGGKVGFEEVFYKRLKLVRPTPNDLEKLARLYRHSLVDGAKQVINRLVNLGKKVIIVTGGYKQAILPAARYLGVKEQNIWAIELAPDKHGYLTKTKPNHILPTTTGKRNLIKWLNPDRKTVFIGDGATDALTRSVVDLFVGFGGVKVRPKIKQQADYYLEENSLLPILDIIKKAEDD